MEGDGKHKPFDKTGLVEEVSRHDSLLTLSRPDSDPLRSTQRSVSATPDLRTPDLQTL
jgi:hypothetical protein